MIKFISLFLIALTFAIPASAKEIAGIKIAETLTIESKTLQLNGAGLREKWVFDVYVGGLYLSSPSNNAMEITNKDSVMAIKLEMLRDVAGKDMAEAIYEGFEAALDDDTSSLAPEIETFLKVFGSEAAKGNVYTLAYLPGKGVNIAINGVYHSTVLGLEFKKALFAIWLGDKPAQESLKEGMLGK